MASPTSSSPFTTLDTCGTYAVDALLHGCKWGGAPGVAATVSYSFPYANGGAATFEGSNAGEYSNIDEPAATPLGLNTAQQLAAKGVLQTWANVANLAFTQVGDTATNVGDIRFAFTSATHVLGTGSPAWGWAYYPGGGSPASGDVWLSEAGTGSLDARWGAGSPNYEGLIHEVGHALGLKHDFEGPFNIIGTRDSALYSVMSYTNPPNNMYFDGKAYVQVSPDAPMLLDIAAMQYLYGANTSYHAGDDTYSFDPQTPFLRTLWDGGGEDTISVANFTTACKIDLRAGNFSDIGIKSKLTSDGAVAPGATYDGTGNLAIAYGVTIENATGGAGDDHLIGNAANNVLRGNGGNDTLEGGDGIDTAVYDGPRSGYAVSVGSQLVVQGGADGQDVLTQVERLQFADKSVAFDLTGNAGTVASLLGAVFGRAAVHDAALAGIALSLADAGVSEAQLVQLALNARLGDAATSDKAVVDLLYANVVGFAPDADAENAYLGLLKGATLSAAGLALMAAHTDINHANVDLVGLAKTGLEYAPA